MREKFEEIFSRGGIKDKMLRRKFRQSRSVKYAVFVGQVSIIGFYKSFFFRGRFSTHFITRGRFVSSGSFCIRHIDAGRRALWPTLLRSNLIESNVVDTA